MSKRSKAMVFSFKETKSDESDLDDEDIAVINKIPQKVPQERWKICMLLGEYVQTTQLKMIQKMLL
ncbi:hypothetical protein KY290_028158 [Solanum tuberosum]|uniref:Uncharacterized protein n=1 Tax=Solanum tuberosum TaxID=4113 RepID=A0ABQ7UIZ3_SOLTU|nr:hypothetical protein KY290_028158 [Solanum tuberosum]